MTVLDNNKIVIKIGGSVLHDENTIELLCNEKSIKDTLCATKKQIIEIFNNDIVIVDVECDDFDKYGRLLANIFINNKNYTSLAIILFRATTLICRAEGRNSMLPIDIDEVTIRAFQEYYASSPLGLFDSMILIFP